MPSTSVLPGWPRSNKKESGSRPLPHARIRSCPEDFRVDEELGFSPDGEGEHVLLHVRKRNRNTDQLSKELARLAGVRARDVSYCGLKDRNAVTTQWFSVWLPGKEDPDWSGIENDDVQILEQARHKRKLQRGALKGNRFEIIVRDIRFDGQNDYQEVMEATLRVIKERGVPNYFGEQRFGREGSNLLRSEEMFKGKRVKDRHLRGLYLSTARSKLFNDVLAARVKSSTWNKILPGEAAVLSGSRSYFSCQYVDEEIIKRLAEGDIHPSGPMWGKGDLPVSGEVEELERSIVDEHETFKSGLEKAGLKQERRALRLMVNDLSWNWLQESDQQTLDLQLTFFLPAGTYATAVLRELVITDA